MESTASQTSILSGNLSQFSVLTLTQFFGLNRQTGELSILPEGDCTRCALFFLDGQIVHAIHDGAVGMPALHSSLDVELGRFTFHAGATSPQRTIDLPLNFLLLESQRIKDELRAIRQDLPPDDTILHLNPQWDWHRGMPDGAWPVLALVNGRRTLGRIAELDGRPVESLQAIHALLACQALLTTFPVTRWRSLIPCPVPATELPAETPFPPRWRTNLLLKAIDGRLDLETLHQRSRLSLPDFWEDLRLLEDTGWITFQGEEDRVFRSLRGDF